MTWTAIDDSALSEIYLVDNDYMMIGYVQETWPVKADATETWLAADSASTAWT